VRFLAWTLAAVVVALGSARAGLVIADAGGGPEGDTASAVGLTLLMAVYAGVGALLSARRPRNAIGWLLLCVALAFASMLFCERLGWHLGDGAAAAWLLWFANSAWILAITPMLVFIPLLFPAGRPRGRLVWVAAGLTAAAVLAGLLAPGQLENYPDVANPAPSVPFAAVVRDGCLLALVLVAVAAIASLARRYRRSAGVERQQIKWVWAAGALLAVTFVLSAALQSVVPSLAEDVQYVGFLAIPAAMAVAILRYRLYDIAVVINRTLVYGALTASLAGVYFASVLLLQLVLQPDSGLAVAGSTLAVAALFRPVRSRIQALVDRRFYRRRYDAARALAGFNLLLREEIDLDSLVRALSGVVDETMQPAHVSVWLRR
jgi:hypothetical protein